MNTFPVVDPIPLPAPVWLFKGLHVVTLALHFTAVQVFLGGLLVAVWLSLRGRMGVGSPLGALRLNAASTLARRLPVVVTFVINLGVPPLLFAQVLYGRALYTSSVLIGVYWISVIFLLTVSYWLVYQFAARTEAARSAWLVGVAAWLLAGAIAFIYSTNMTLMLRPEQWGAMYSATAVGWRLPPADPTLGPRWVFMLTGGLAMGGLWMIWLSGRKHLSDGVRGYLASNGGRLAAVIIVAQAVAAYWVFRVQPDAVRSGLLGTPHCRLAGLAWMGVAGLIVVLGLRCGWRRAPALNLSWMAAGLGLVATLSAVVYRDGIRDLTLQSKGFDVWQRTVTANWPVVALFLVAFVAGLAAVGWLVSVMRRAKPVSEEVL